MTPADLPDYDPIKAAWNTVATYETYDDAQAAVTSLSNDGFPIENIDIVGSDVRLLERVTARMTRRRSLGNSALNGIVLGVLIGLLMGLFAPGFAWLGMAAAGALIGATWGAAFGLAAHGLSDAERGFASARRLVASRYDLVVRNGLAEQARNTLAHAGLLPAS
ncbi:hypothetical protein G1H11_09215 [Phytoactinopolyspora alkaliphila]|uniref:General stress protein 17M-like domain-containing protein n=1 Tax=Phytoactinopolyspora alkaliphila TaxID=1783498 RepID=A0A6N9YKK8_9ACTN|nr:general stress protein [Phytoactinopolyspora alkaliphila]NED95492.1 hypothetical protein [Phytoactinopolyspora alkaliphila]